MVLEPPGEAPGCPSETYHLLPFSQPSAPMRFNLRSQAGQQPKKGLAAAFTAIQVGLDMRNVIAELAPTDYRQLEPIKYIFDGKTMLSDEARELWLLWKVPLQVPSIYSLISQASLLPVL
jgi:hypothetical protein